MSYPELFEAPFVVTHRRLDQTPQGYLPDARLIVLPSLRASGMLTALSDRQARLLLTLLTFTSGNGEVRATALQIGRVLRVPAPMAALWLQRFASRRFGGVPLIRYLGREEGHSLYSLAHEVVSHERTGELQNDEAALTAAPRTEVIEYSRQHYTRPRADVEREVLAFLGHAPEEQLKTPEGEVWRTLHILKFSHDDIRGLISRFGVERILQQLKWLPERRAKNPARMLIAALQRDFPAPQRISDGLPSQAAEEANG